MPFDAVFLYALTDELKENLIGAKVSKVHMPKRDEVVLILRGYDNQRLLLSANANYPRIHLTNEVKSNPDTPPMFCMLLRKHLTSAKIIDVEQLSFERVLRIRFTVYNELGDIENKSLILEILGRQSNIILTDGEDRIIDSLRRIDISEKGSRQIIPGIKYSLPDSQNKFNPITNFENIQNELLSSTKHDRADKVLISTVMGISPLLSREIVFKTFGEDVDFGELSEFKRQMLIKNLKVFFEDVIEHKTKTTMLISEGGKPKDFTVVEIQQYGSLYKNVEFDSYSLLLEEYYREKDKIELLKNRSHDIAKIISNNTDKLKRKIALQTEELKECADREKYRIYGELLTANISTIEKGATSVRVQNYYDENLSEVTIPLDVKKSPSQNAQNYFKKYQKLKNAEIMLNKQIEAAKEEIEYFETISDLLNRAESEEDINEIRNELISEGYIKVNKKALKRAGKSNPLTFKSSDGFKIMVGRNNIQNDMLTFKMADKNDIWLHTLNIPGSHVIIFTENREPTEKTLNEAAVIAAFHSKSKMSQNVPVTYTKVKYVNKPSGAKPGFVIFTNYKTIYATPSEELIEKLKTGQSH